ncbi:MAG: tetratricopeptide repeat protein [Thermodesulfobacteriota bacterium]
MKNTVIETDRTGGLRGRKATLLAALLVSCVTFLAYLPALDNGFVNWDDPAYVYENPNIRSLDAEFFRQLPTAVVSSNWHPLTVLSHGVDCALWGPDPMGHHLSSVVLHALNTFLVFILAVRLVGAALPVRALAAGAVTALLFGLHPLHVESVAWVSERKDVLYSFFFLLSVLAYLRYVSSEKGGGKATAYAASLGFFALSLMSKPMAVTLPLVLLILDYYPLGRLKAKRVVVEKVPFFLLSAVAALAAIWTQHEGETISSLGLNPLITRILVSIRAYVFYLYKMVLPLDLAPLYPYPTDINALSLEYAGAFLLLLAITALCVLAIKKKPGLSALWLYYLVTLFPVIGVVTFGAHEAADRYTYLPALGPFLLAGVGAAAVYERFSKELRGKVIVAAAVLLISAALVYKTEKQIAVWKDSITLWTHEIDLLPEESHSALYGYYNRGAAYYELGNCPEAVRDLTRTIKLSTRFADAYKMRATCLLRLGDYGRAIGDMTSYLEFDPTAAAIYNDRGNAYLITGNARAAIKDYEKVIELNPGHPNAYYNLGTLYANMGENEKAAVYFKGAAHLGIPEAEERLRELGAGQ